MSERAEFLIDLSALASNVSKLKKQCGVELMAVVKADAVSYTHLTLPTNREV